MKGFPIGNRLRAASMVRLTLVAAVSPTGQRDVSAATLFVSPAGDDRATGTDSDPLQTISKAADRAQPGDTIWYVRESIASG